MSRVIAHLFYRFVGGNTTVPVTLGLRNIYIVPTRYGLLYLVVIGAMLIGSINYNNNLGFLLTFLLGGMGLTTMLYTYRMLYGLRLEKVSTRPVFAGESMPFLIRLADIDRPRMGVGWFFEGQDPVLADLLQGTAETVSVNAPTAARGKFSPGWLRVTCTYPLGLFRAWARLHPNVTGLVYPRPLSGPLVADPVRSGNGGGPVSGQTGVDDFQGLKAYQAGDAPQRIHWQAFSRGRGLHTKTFADPAGQSLLLDLARIDGSDTEKKLSILCYHVLRAHHYRRPFGLALSGRTIPVASGEAHRGRCLRALACFGSE
ncbi:conserved hypothetical protein [Desulfosarcina cetonica]|uniref:DUF58 domain-containing protein n=1 Tax=Desulfosarcina cetonica TaxID=90730 RepID=UPI0006D1AC00|nr:DUF58 domain-containing protein [Desulfosarcina cetonica]VTR66449.1 conserved hypothetical protein [Desulfosarcina cetonica]